MLYQLQDAEETRLTQITARQSSFKTRISAYSKIQGVVEAVQKAAAALGDSATLGAVKSSVSGEGLTVKTESGAVAGNYQLGIGRASRRERVCQAVMNPVGAG